jgi:hypothetical protein
MDFDQTWYIQSLRESGTLLIFKVKGQGRRVKFLGEGICHALRCPCLDYIFKQHFNKKLLRRLDRISKRNTKFSIFCLMTCSGQKNQNISIGHRTNFFASRPSSLCGGTTYEVPTLDLYKWFINRSSPNILHNLKSQC